MSLISALVSTVYASLPAPLRSPSPRKSEGAREFDGLLVELVRNEQLAGDSFAGVPAGVRCVPARAPERARLRRARQ
jgi:hypothetical protein